MCRQDIVGQMFFTNDTILNENEVTLTDDLILNICMKLFLISLLAREFSLPD